MSTQASPRGIVAVLLSVVPVAAAGLIGQIATFPNLAPWYAGLAKPSFNPPNWIFGPVWGALYALMAFALWTLIVAPRGGARTRAIWTFATQLALNALWSFLFFGLRSPALGLADILPQLCAIGATIALARRVDGRASLALVPLFFWVAFATLLNVAIWRLN